ncbi:MAG: aldo/keto reductase [Desulfosarcina sp.]|nr:aldo/keto reductase [Desulfosarcina sp.]MBC2742626.1 aldo/keto reductase [Desulfosarcina sp.]MBC2765536.1 aldo/keto reductase [Desulfosarcina sp.]
MNDKPHSISRRSFLKSAGAVGLGSALAPLAGRERAAAANPAAAADVDRMPTRPFGKTGVNVPILSLGGMFDIPSNQTMLKQAMRWGVTYWDTAHIYSGGRSEEGIGQYFKHYPRHREKIFLVTKSTARTRWGMTKDLNTSLKRMNTDHIDLFFIHAVRDASIMDSGIREWAKMQKAEGKIRLFGFSTHSNMEECLLDAARLNCIDGIMTTYNFRLMHEKKMKAAVKACVDAGIGLTAMKTQGGGSVGTASSRDLELAGRFVQKGFTDKQAKLKAVWENPHISAICSQMPTMSILMANIAAAVDRTSLTENDRHHLRQYARETFSNYCAGCTQICQNAIAGNIPVGDVMRYLMYARSYEDSDEARRLFAAIPHSARQQMAREDYTVAEARCPRQLPIARLMNEAIKELA